MDKDKQQICSIRIMFTVDTDEEAIDCKKKIAEALKHKPDIQLQFSLANVPTSPIRG